MNGFPLMTNRRSLVVLSSFEVVVQNPFRPISCQGCSSISNFVFVVVQIHFLYSGKETLGKWPRKCHEKLNVHDSFHHGVESLEWVLTTKILIEIRQLETQLIVSFFFFSVSNLQKVVSCENAFLWNYVMLHWNESC